MQKGEVAAERSDYATKEGCDVQIRKAQDSLCKGKITGGRLMFAQEEMDAGGAKKSSYVDVEMKETEITPGNRRIPRRERPPRYNREWPASTPN